MPACHTCTPPALVIITPACAYRADITSVCVIDYFTRCTHYYPFLVSHPSPYSHVAVVFLAVVFIGEQCTAAAVLYTCARCTAHLCMLHGISVPAARYICACCTVHLCPLYGVYSMMRYIDSCCRVRYCLILALRS